MWVHEKWFTFYIKRKCRTRELELYEFAFSLGRYKDKEKKYEGKEDFYG